jgi:hypothetical protein
VAGVEQVVTAHALPDDPELVEALARSDAGYDPHAVLMRCVDAAAIGFGACDGTTVLYVRGDGTAVGVPVTDHVPVAALPDLPVVSVAAVTDGRPGTIEQARTQLELGFPGTAAVTQEDIDAETLSTVRTTERVSNIALSVTLVLAGCSLAVAVAGAIVERRQPFTLLRLAGTRLSDLRRIVLAEAAAPLLTVSAASVGLGLAVTAVALESGGDNPSFALPGAGYWLALAGGVALALLVVLATMPLLDRLTSSDTVRFE